MIERLLALESSGIKLGLRNISRLCEALGHPERRFASLHVAGTNGKGSVTAMAHAALLASGLRAGRYTSPHLTDITERFVVGTQPVDADALTAVAEHVMDCADRLRADGTLHAPPTFFEATTAIAFELFRRAGVEAAVIEVGLGGRFDATNVLSPIATAVTTIALDHQQHLGETLSAIAFEKAGIIKPGVPVVIGPLPSDAELVIARVAAQRNAPLIQAVRDTTVESTMRDGRAHLAMQTPDGRYGPVALALRGEHQLPNALVAVRLLEVARACGLAITTAAIEEGLARAVWPARLELLTLGDGRRLLLDAAHNPEGARALAAYLHRWHAERPALVAGVMRDKDAAEILRALLPAVSTVIATTPPSARALSAGELAQCATAIRAERPALAGGDGAGPFGDVASCGPDVITEGDPMRAVARAFQTADTVCVAGSLFLAAAVRDGFRHAILR